eukprot:s2680_g1.t1
MARQSSVMIYGLAACLCLWALSSQMSFVNPGSQRREVSVSAEAGYFPAPSLYVGKISTQDKSVFVANGFVPHWRETFSSTGEACWFVVEFDPSEVSWNRFEEILGATDPSKASTDSIRGLLYQHYKDCGLSQQPTTMDNGVHFSAGALEGMRERMLWTNISPEEDPLGRLLLSSGVPRKFLDEWMDNPNVDGWYIGTKRMSGPLFACTEACDTVTFRDSAIRFLRDKGEVLHCRRAKKAPSPELAPVDEEYGRHFMSLARCQGQGSDPLVCARFVRHAFFGAPPEALPREAVHEWLQSHLGAASDDALTALEATLGNFGTSRRGGTSNCFVYGQGSVEAWYKPLLFRSFMEGQRFLARRRLKQQGFKETRDPKIRDLSYWERCDGDADEPPLLVLHGYGRGLASPLFDALLPALGRRRVIIVDCGWLLVTRVPLRGDLEKSVPTVRQIAEAVAAKLERQPVDILAHSFGTAVASALLQKLQAGSAGAVQRAVLMDPMCFIPGISKQAQLLRRTPMDLTTELLSESVPGSSSGFSMWEVLWNVVDRPDPCVSASLDEETAAAERRKWIIYQTYFFNYFIFRDLVYSWVNNRALFGPEYLDRGLLLEMNRQQRLLTVVAETDTMIPSAQLRVELESEGSIMWLPTVGHGACQHREDVARRIQHFLSCDPPRIPSVDVSPRAVASESRRNRWRKRQKLTNWTTDTAGGEKPKRMTILHFNDVYNVEPRAKEPVGGIARFVTRIKELKAESVARGEYEAVVLFSGDAFNPSLMRHGCRANPQKSLEI